MFGPSFTPDISSFQSICKTGRAELVFPIAQLPNGGTVHLTLEALLHPQRIRLSVLGTTHEFVAEKALALQLSFPVPTSLTGLYTVQFEIISSPPYHTVLITDLRICGTAAANTPPPDNAVSEPFERKNGKQYGPCHLRSLFVRHTGEVFPCCKRWNMPNYRIGHMRDANIADAILDYHIPCECDTNICRPARPEERQVLGLNIEFALTCNAECAMCCVHAPFWKGTYDGYDALFQLVAHLKPKTIASQGGEVGVQKQAMDLLKRIKSAFPDIKHHIVSNGCFPPDYADTFSGIFSSTTISMVGISPHIYHTIMNLDVSRTKEFAKRLIDAGTTKVNLKFLVTPISLVDLPLFLDWAVSMGPDSINLADSTLLRYIKEDEIAIWSTVIRRVGEQVRAKLAEHSAEITRKNIALVIERSLETLFDIRST